MVNNTSASAIINTNYEIREYISPASKRAASISSVLSFLLILKALGAVPTDTAIRLPIVALPITQDAAFVLFPLINTVLFLMWAIRYFNERQYIGAVRQENTVKIEQDLQKYEQGILSGTEDLEKREKIFKENLLLSQIEYQNAWTYDETEATGFRMKLRIGNEEIAQKDDNWMGLEKARSNHRSNKEAYQNTRKLHDKLATLDKNLSLHSQLSYVGAPVALFIGALVLYVADLFTSLIPLVFVDH